MCVCVCTWCEYIWISMVDIRVSLVGNETCGKEKFVRNVFDLKWISAKDLNFLFSFSRKIGKLYCRRRNFACFGNSCSVLDISKCSMWIVSISPLGLKMTQSQFWAKKKSFFSVISAVSIEQCVCVVTGYLQLDHASVSIKLCAYCIHMLHSNVSAFCAYH